MKRGLAAQIDIKRVLLNDEKEIDELTEVDPWKVPKSFTLDKLREGWLCFVAKKDGRIVASTWAIVNHSFKDEFMNRYFILGSNEAFYWRGFCVPDSGLRGIYPWFSSNIRERIGNEYGKTRHLSFVRTTNVTIQRALTMIGCKVVGRAGFVDVFGVRFHYLWGHDAFKETRKRTFIQLNAKRPR